MQVLKETCMLKGVIRFNGKLPFFFKNFHELKKSFNFA